MSTGMVVGSNRQRRKHWRVRDGITLCWLGHGERWSDGVADKKQEETRERSWGLYHRSLRESLSPTVNLSQPLFAWWSEEVRNRMKRRSHGCRRGRGEEFDMSANCSSISTEEGARKCRMSYLGTNMQDSCPLTGMTSRGTCIWRCLTSSLGRN